MSRKKIVLVDDEPDVTMFLQTALEDCGYEAMTASNAADGMKLIKSHNPNLVCLDILMPEESGISLFQKMKTDPSLKSIPVLIHSGLSFSRELRRIDYLHSKDGTRLPEPDGVMEKPVNIDQFIELVAKIIN